MLGARPCGEASGLTCQSPSPEVSSRAAEPTVVEHEAFDADGGSDVGQALQRYEIVIEVDRFQVLRMTDRGGRPGRSRHRTRRWKDCDTALSPAGDHAATTSGAA